MQKAVFALPRNLRSHELLIILACYIRIGLGDTADLPFLGPKKGKKIDTQKKQSSGRTCLICNLSCSIICTDSGHIGFSPHSNALSQLYIYSYLQQVKVLEAAF